MNQPLVSIIYPVYNDLPSDISLSLTSIVEQDYINLEIIIIDDSTNPESIKAIDSFDDSRIKVIRIKSKGGLAQALNIAIKKSKGTYIARADADDIQYKNRISKQVEFLEKNSEIGILGSNIYYINEHGEIVKKRCYPESNSKIRQYLHLRNPICHSVVMIRKSVLDQIGYYNPEYKRAEDYELWFRAASHNVKLFNLQDVLMSYKMASAAKRDDLNWKMNLKLKMTYFSARYFLESAMGIVSIFVYRYTPKSIQNFVYSRLA